MNWNASQVIGKGNVDDSIIVSTVLETVSHSQDTGGDLRCLGFFFLFPDRISKFLACASQAVRGKTKLGRNHSELLEATHMAVDK